MSDQMIPQVSNPQLDTPRYVQATEGVASVSKEESQEVLDQGKAVMRSEEGDQSDTKTQIQKREAKAKQRMGDIYLKFQIDDNNDLTIFMLDKERQTVVRTIPADEIARMSAGELIELFI